MYDPVQIQIYEQTSFAGGMNTASAPDRIAPDEALQISNMRFGEDDSLLSRPGTKMSIETIGGAAITKRITSLFQARFSGGTKRMFFTITDKIYEDVAGVATDRTGAISVNNSYWQWKMYADLAIGIHAGLQPIKFTTGAGNAAVLGGSPPGGQYLEIWNDRLWIAGAGNTLHGSKLGDPENWVVTGLADGAVQIDIEPEDNDFITGIVAFRDRLVIFKRSRIYTLQTIAGAPSTDATALSVSLYAQGVGCISAYSIQPVLDDILFLTPSGVASLVAAARVGDFESALLSNKLKELSQFRHNVDTVVEMAAFVIPEHTQYKLMVKDGPSYILDYRRIQNGIVRWTTYTGAAAGDVMCATTDSQGQVVYKIGGRFGDYRIFDYVPEVVPSTATHRYLDNVGSSAGSSGIPFGLITRIVDCDNRYVRKDFVRMFFDFVTIFGADNTEIDIIYRFDNTFGRSGSWDVTLPTPTGVGVGDQHKMNRKFKYDSVGSRGTTVLFILTCTSTGGLKYAFGIKGFAVAYVPLTPKRSRNV